MRDLGTVFGWLLGIAALPAWGQQPPLTPQMVETCVALTRAKQSALTEGLRAERLVVRLERRVHDEILERRTLLDTARVDPATRRDLLLVEARLSLHQAELSDALAEFRARIGKQVAATAAFQAKCEGRSYYPEDLERAERLQDQDAAEPGQ